ncbi:YhcN/YlaJ family sporulation lipoprotein [Desulfallas thermosapovorans]|uniref:Sporulation lipoprotein YhcN/YlaJ n=1 Tax=Desulfallas thermosapovorans DSM 6562 TaxID=1121431 RepID=A0A5S4ZWA4_9FIRM|nr:YhcN/YlaJ family sporulation lipoprotein [Desulfallas thermosapovorans]TYO97298.1 sporulation lipoprotein YhcN/YlaJ [Desulfallas thermosapovorans DSM 6562]
MNKLTKAATLFSMIWIIAICLVTGCVTVETPQRKPQPQTGQVEGQAYINNELKEQVEKTAGTVQGVKESTALVMNDQIAVAVKVTGFDRLHLKGIRQDLHSRVKGIAPEYDVHVTTDKKLFAQLQKLAGEIKNTPQGNLPAQVKDKFNVIIEDMNG